MDLGGIKIKDGVTFVHYAERELNILRGDKMQIAPYEDRIAIEVKRRINSMWCSILNDFNIKSGSKDEWRTVEGIRRGLLLSLDDVNKWLATPNGGGNKK